MAVGHDMAGRVPDEAGSQTEILVSAGPLATAAKHLDYGRSRRRVQLNGRVAWRWENGIEGQNSGGDAWPDRSAAARGQPEPRNARKGYRQSCRWHGSLPGRGTLGGRRLACLTLINSKSASCRMVQPAMEPSLMTDLLSLESRLSEVRTAAGDVSSDDMKLWSASERTRFERELRWCIGKLQEFDLRLQADAQAHRR